MASGSSIGFTDASAVVAICASLQFNIPFSATRLCVKDYKMWMMSMACKKTKRGLKYEDLLLCSVPYTVYNDQYLSLVIAGTGQAAKQQAEECRQNFSQSARSVCHNNLPHMQSRLSHHESHIWPPHVQPCQYSVSASSAKSINDSLKN